MLVGHRTWKFENQPVIISTGTVAGPFEGQGKIANDYDLIHEDLWMGQDSYEKAHRIMFEEACENALNKSGLTKDKIQYIIAGDLVNQITPTSFASRKLSIPYLGLFGACSTSMEGLALSAFIINYGGAEYILTGSTSHNAAIEKQFRYPTEYGSQKPPTAQWTATASGVALIAKEGSGPVVTSATIGKVIDMGLSDPFNMGAAMAPAAVDTIEAHLKDLNISANYYDIIATGDLGKIGYSIASELFEKHHVEIGEGIFQDCGLMIYREDQPVFSGASGSGCSAVVTYGHLLNRMKAGELKRILIVATGALLSPLSYQQKETIPCIAHAVSIEMGEASV